VSRIVLLSLDVGFDIGRRHETYCVPERLEFARPMMRRCAGLNADEAWRQLLEECQDITSLQLAPDDHLAYRVDAVDLKNDFAMSRPIVVTPCMLPSSESWSPQRRPPQWHLRAGGGAVHSITSRHPSPTKSSTPVGRDCWREPLLAKAKLGSITECPATKLSRIGDEGVDYRADPDNATPVANEVIYSISLKSFPYRG